MQVDEKAVEIVELKFVNSDAMPKTQVLHVAPDSVAPIMAWYGAYFAGDRYAAYVDGKKVPKDRNGELLTALEAAGGRG